MAIDPRTPVIVGVGQLVRRPTADEVEHATEPAEMMAEVLRLAASDSGAGPSLLRVVQSIRVVDSVSWFYNDPGQAVEDHLGISGRETVRTTIGGNSPQMLVNDTAAAIARGDMEIGVIVGAEAVYTRLVARKAKVWLPWSTSQERRGSPTVLGVDTPGNSDFEMERGLVLPTQVYPMFENALRAEAGESLEEHQCRVSELWSRFSAVAARNPYAWAPQERTPEEIRTVTPENRMVAFPYPKLMNANIQTDQAAALIMCSVSAAQRRGVPEDRWVFPWSGVDAYDTSFVSERESLTASPPLRAVRDMLPVGDVAHVDLYSCFPSAVQIAARELGLGLDRQLTVTGGLGFAGGPANNYVTHSLAAMVDVLRHDPGSLGLVTAVGWYLTKHSVGLYSTSPPPDGFRHLPFAVEVPRREVAPEYEGEVMVESYTVQFDRDGQPETSLFALRTPDGRRTWGRCGGVDVDEEQCGRSARVAADGTVTLR